jgi:hypothetical protein
MALRILFFFDSSTKELPVITRETVLFETPAILAMSEIVAVFMNTAPFLQEIGFTMRETFSSVKEYSRSILK